MQRRPAAPARATFLANATVLGALADVHAGADAVDAAVGGLERALAKLAVELSAFGPELVAPLLAALVRLCERGDCKCARTHHLGLHEAACEAPRRTFSGRPWGCLLRAPLGLGRWRAGEVAAGGPLSARGARDEARPAQGNLVMLAYARGAPLDRRQFAVDLLWRRCSL